MPRNPPSVWASLLLLAACAERGTTVTISFEGALDLKQLFLSATTASGALFRDEPIPESPGEIDVSAGETLVLYLPEVWTQGEVTISAHSMSEGQITARGEARITPENGTDGPLRLNLVASACGPLGDETKCVAERTACLENGSLPASSSRWDACGSAIASLDDLRTAIEWVELNVPSSAARTIIGLQDGLYPRQDSDKAAIELSGPPIELRPRSDGPGRTSIGAPLIIRSPGHRIAELTWAIGGGRQSGDAIITLESGATGVSVVGNEIGVGGGPGLQWIGVDVRSEGNEILGNLISRSPPSTSGSDGGSIGVRLFAPRNVVAMNVIHMPVGKGIQIESGSPQTVRVDQNTIDTVPGAGIFVASGAACLRNNLIDGREMGANAIEWRAAALDPTDCTSGGNAIMVKELGYSPQCRRECKQSDQPCDQRCYGCFAFASADYNLVSTAGCVIHPAIVDVASDLGYDKLSRIPSVGCELDTCSAGNGPDIGARELNSNQTFIREDRLKCKIMR